MEEEEENDENKTERKKKKTSLREIGKGNNPIWKRYSQYSAEFNHKSDHVENKWKIFGITIWH